MRFFRKYATYLTNGEVYCKIVGSRYDCGVKLPDGVIFGQDRDGNMFLDGKKAWLTIREDCE